MKKALISHTHRFSLKVSVHFSGHRFSLLGLQVMLVHSSAAEKKSFSLMLTYLGLIVRKSHGLFT